MPSGFVGQAWIQVSPSFSGFQTQIARQLTSEMSGAGDRAGRELASSIAGSFGRGAAQVGRAAANVAGVATMSLLGFAAANVQTYTRARQFENALQLVGNQMGVSNTVIQDGIRRMTGLGASQETARNTMMAFIRTGGDAAQAWRLYARAEDIAVTTGRSGNDVMQELIYGLQTGNTNLRIFRDINLNATKAQDAYAASIGKSRKELTDSERQQALFNAVMERTANIAGVAGRMMTEGPFNWTAMKAPIQNIREAMGGLLEPAFTAVGRQVFQLAIAFNTAISAGGKFYPVVEVIRRTALKLAQPIAQVAQQIREFIAGVSANTVATFAAGLREVAPILPGIVTALSVFAGQNLLRNIPIVGDEFSRLLGKLGPVKGGIIALALSFPPVQQAIGRVVAALAPLIAALGGTFTRVVAALTPVLERLLGELLGPLTDTIRALAPVVAVLAQALLPVARVLAWILDTIEPIIAPLTWLAIGIGVVAVATWAWTAATTALAAASAPFYIITVAIIAAVAALVVGIVWLATNWSTAWEAIKTAATAAWEYAIRPVFDALKAGFDAVIGAGRAVADAFIWLWQTILYPVFAAIATAFGAMVTAIKWFWDTILYPVIEAVWTVASILLRIYIAPILLAIWLAWQAMTLAIRFFWNTILLPVWNAVQAVATWMWNAVLRPIFAAVAAAWGATLAAMRWVWLSVLQPTFQAIAAVFGWLWTWVLRPAWAALQATWNAMLATMRFVWDSVLKPAWQAMQIVWRAVGTTISAVYNTTIVPVFNALKVAVDAVKRAFEAAKNGIAAAWDAVKNAVKQPVKWVIDVIINPFIGGVNWIIKKFGIPEIPKISTAGWAEGGRIPGRAPGRGDNMLAWVRSGEYILTERQSRAIGYENLDRLPRFASGGPVGRGGFGAPLDPWAGIGMAWYNPVEHIKRAAGWAVSGFHALGDLGGDIFNAATGLLRHGVAAAFEAGLEPLKALLNQIPLGDTGWASDIKTGVLWIMDRAVEWVRGHEEAAPALGGMPIDDIVAQVLAVFPALRVTSALRKGDPGYHGRNLARDLGGPVPIMNQAGGWISAMLTGALAEGIHSGPQGQPFLSVKNGRQVPPSFWGAGTWAGHRDHIHIASEAAVTIGGAVGDWISEAIRLTGVQSGVWMTALARQVQSESGGNPRAINLTDSNAKKGTPSKGIVQVIDPTFRQYMLPGRGNIWNPVDNLAAAIRYIMGRYGASPGNLGRWRPGVAYDEGGWLPPGVTIAVNNTGQPEPILTAAQWEQLADALRQNPTNPNGTAPEIVGLLRRIARAAEAGQTVVIDGREVARVVNREMAWVA